MPSVNQLNMFKNNILSSLKKFCESNKELACCKTNATSKINNSLKGRNNIKISVAVQGIKIERIITNSLLRNTLMTNKLMFAIQTLVICR